VDLRAFWFDFGGASDIAAYRGLLVWQLPEVGSTRRNAVGRADVQDPNSERGLGQAWRFLLRRRAETRLAFSAIEQIPRAMVKSKVVESKVREKSLATTYSPTDERQYHRRGRA
jgi:hypothetical protein